MSNKIDTVELHMTFDDDNVSWNALEKMGYMGIYEFFRSLLKDNQSAIEKLDSSDTIILIDDINGKRIEVHNRVLQSETGRCQSIW